MQSEIVSEEEEQEGIEIPQLEDRMMEEIVAASMIVNHRFMYEFFDAKKAKVFLIDRGQSVGYEINGEDKGVAFNTRVEAEQDAFKKCFEIVENQEDVTKD